MLLTEKQQILCGRIYKSVRNKENIDEIVREVTKDDFLTIFTAIYNKSEETLLGTFEATSVGHLKAVLKFAKELGLLEEVVRAKILSSKNKDKVQSISLIECITDPSRQHPSKVLDNVLEVFKKEFFASLSEDELKKIKVAIERELENETDLMEQQNLKKLIGSIGEFIENGVKAESSTGKINRNEVTVKGNVKGNQKVENKLFSPTSKAIVAGAICGVIAALAVGGGLFAAGASLPILALIGIAVAAAVLTGLVAGGITYKISKPSGNVDNVDLLSGEIYASLGV